MSQSSLKRSSGDAKLELLQCTSKKLFGAPILKQRKKPLQRRGQAKPEFADYIPLSKEFTTETDHKPLMPSLDQNVFMSCLPASTISHETDAILEIDSLRSWKRPLQSTNEEKQLNDELNLYVSHVTDYLWIRLYQDENEICSNLKEFCREGWPNKHSLKFALPCILLAVQRRNNRPARHPDQKRQSYHSFNLETGRPGQDTYWSPGHSQMPRESQKWSLLTRPQQTNQSSR